MREKGRKGGELESVAFDSFISVYGGKRGNNVCSPLFIVHTVHSGSLYKPPLALNNSEKIQVFLMT